MFRRKKSQFKVNEFTVLGAFIAVAIFGLLYGILAVALGRVEFRNPGTMPYIEPVVALTPEQYEADVREVLAPFIEQARLMQPEDLATDNGTMAQLVQKTQDRLFRVQRLPKEYRDVHLAFVLLLDQWKRALAGSVPDREVVLEKTDALLAENPWLEQQ